MSDLWDGIKVHHLASPGKRPTPSSSDPLVLKDLGKRYYFPAEDNEEDCLGQASPRMNTGSTNMRDAGDGICGGDGSGGGGLTEMESYRLEKQIKEILTNPEGLESDVVCASIYGVVEPDVDAPVDRLQVVICAILEHIMQDSRQHPDSDIAFAILDTYSDAIEFGTAMIKVINELKEKFVKKHQSDRLSNSHKDFAHVMALVFRQAEDWEQGACKTVQDLAVAWVERWVIFNKQRHLSGDDLVKCELIFLESAQTFLMECHHLLSLKYPSNLREIMSDIRCKLLEDKTARSVRTILLDMMLYFHPSKGPMDKDIVTCSVGTQTESSSEGRHSKFIRPSNVNCGGDNLSERTTMTKPDSYSYINPSLPVFTHTNSVSDLKSSDTNYISSSSQIDLMDLPYNVRNLPPRLLKKYLQERGLMELQPSLETSGNFNVNDSSLANESDDVSTDFDANAASPFIVPKVVSSQSHKAQGSDSQKVCGTEVTADTEYLVESPIQEQSENLTSQLGMDEYVPSTMTYNENEPSSRKTVPDRISCPKISRSPKTVVEETSLSPQSVVEPPPHSPATVIKTTSPSPLSALPVVQCDPICSSGSIGLTGSQHLEDWGINMSKSSWPREENVDSLQDPERGVQSDQESNGPESVETKIADKPIVKVNVRIERDTTIRYTPQQLRDLNPSRGLPKVPLWELWEPKEVLDKMIVLKNPGKSSLKEEEASGLRTSSKSKLNPLASEFNWRRELDSSSENKKQSGSSRDPGPGTKSDQSQSLDDDKQSGGFVYEGSGNGFVRNGSCVGLQGIASDLFTSDSGNGTDVSMNLTKDVGGGEDWSGEMWHDSSGDVGTVGDFLIPSKPEKTKKAKKKRGREIPLDQFLKEQEEKKREAVGVECVEDQKDDVGMDDLFSPESLKMYEELEQQGVGTDDGSEEVWSFTMGSHVSSSSKRPAMFTMQRPEQSMGKKAPKPWTPASRRFCTRCGSKDHVVYDCNEMSSRLLQ